MIASGIIIVTNKSLEFRNFAHSYWNWQQAKDVSNAKHVLTAAHIEDNLVALVEPEVVRLSASSVDAYWQDPTAKADRHFLVKQYDAQVTSCAQVQTTLKRHANEDYWNTASEYKSHLEQPVTAHDSYWSWSSDSAPAVQPQAAVVPMEPSPAVVVLENPGYWDW